MTIFGNQLLKVMMNQWIIHYQLLRIFKYLPVVRIK